MIMVDYKKIFDDIWNEISVFAEVGHQADYIPALAKVNPDQFGMCLRITPVN